MMSRLILESMYTYTPLAVVSRARKTLRVSTTAGIAQIPAVSSKEVAVIGENSIEVITDIRHMNNC
jgi:hypothetical protein